MVMIVAKNLNKNGTYMINVPVNKTSDYINSKVLKISIIGGIFLALLATLSIISNFYQSNAFKSWTFRY